MNSQSIKKIEINLVMKIIKVTKGIKQIVIFCILSLSLNVFAERSQSPYWGGRFYNNSFDENYERYGSPDDFYNQFNRIIPNASTLLYANADCRELTENNSGIWGNDEPRFGKPINGQPGALFLPTYTNCLIAVLKGGLAETISLTVLESNYAHLISSRLVEELKKEFLSKLDETSRNMFVSNGYLIFTIANSPVQTYPIELRKKIIRQLLLSMGGPESVLRHYQLIGSQTVFGEKLDTIDALVDFLYLKTGGDSSGKSIFTFVKEIVIVLRIGPLLIN